jgi:hypothetical protein
VGERASLKLLLRVMREVDSEGIFVYKKIHLKKTRVLVAGTNKAGRLGQSDRQVG